MGRPGQPASALFRLLSKPPVRVITNAEDFQRALGKPWLAKTPHFAVHHHPQGVSRRGPTTGKSDLSSVAASIEAQPVDNSLENPVDNSVDRTLETAWAGYVVPKRHARRAVTRNLLRRQMRQVLREQQAALPGLPAGLWVLRLRQGFDRAAFPSAASTPLRQQARLELQALMESAVRRLRGPNS
jgi:ribonuclease P protein component